MNQFPITLLLSILLIVLAAAAEAIALLCETWDQKTVAGKSVKTLSLAAKGSIALIVVAAFAALAREYISNQETAAKDTAILAAQESEKAAIEAAENRMRYRQELCTAV